MTLSVVIITKNTEKKIEDCLESIKDLADEIILLDGGSTDKTISLGKKYNAKIYKQKGKNFALWRTQAKGVANGEWLFYVDYDERVSEELREEIKRETQTSKFSAFDMPRKNFVFGKYLRYGGWYPDYVLRLIKKKNLLRWDGEVHEQPKINGSIGRLKNALVHIKEENIGDMVTKTNRYATFEAKLLFDAGHPPVTWWRFMRVILQEIWHRLVIKLGVLDGPEGIIYCVYQGYSRFVTYAKLWEMQKTQTPKK